MAEAQTEIQIGAKQQPARKTWSHPLIELTLARVREFIRQPEAVFWVFGFPVLLAFALGIAFRNSAPEKVRVAVDNSTASAGETAAAISRSATLEAVSLNPNDAAQALRTGKVALIVQTKSETRSSEASKAYEYRFDPARPESRSARLLVDDVLQRDAGRKDVAAVSEQTFTEPGARYIDFLI